MCSKVCMTEILSMLDLSYISCVGKIEIEETTNVPTLVFGHIYMSFRVAVGHFYTCFHI